MKRSLDLMSERAHTRELTRRRVRVWACVLGAALVGLAPIAGWALRRAHTLGASCEAAVSRYEPVRRMKLDNGRLAKTIEELEEGQRIPLTLSEERPVLALIGVAAAALAQHRGVVYLNQIELEQDPLAAASDNSPRASFVLEGAAADGRAIANVADSLQESGPFVKVDVKTSDGRREGNQKLTTFTIECAY